MIACSVCLFKEEAAWPKSSLYNFRYNIDSSVNGVHNCGTMRSRWSI